MPNFNIEITDAGIDLSAELEKIEKIIIEKALLRTKGSKTKAAKLLNVTFDSLRYRMEKLGVE
jgi:two-component system response regulator PilR (NtrC family)